MLLPSGDHSNPETPSGASVGARGAEPENGMAKTCGLSPANASSASVEPSGDQRRLGAGAGVLKVRIDSPRRVGVPPRAETTYSAPSCSSLGRFGVETT